MKKILFLSLLLFNINVFANEDLLDLKVNGEDAKCTGYECSVEVKTGSAQITYKKGDNVKASIPESGYKITFDNEHSVQIEVTYEDDTTANYTLKITKHVKSADNTLKKLVINDEEIELKKDVFVYSYETNFDDDKVIIKGTTNDQNASCEEEEAEFDLEKSSLSLEYPVTSENGNVKNYTIILKRKPKPDTTLKTLSLSDIELDFKSDQLDYEVTIPYSIDSTKVKATANNDNATVDVSMEEFFTIGENFIKISVTNEEANDTYVIKINRLEKIDETIANLKNLEVRGYKFKFNPNVYEYDLFFNEIPNRLDINYKKVKEEANVLINDNNNLKEGSIVSIKVSLDNGLVKTYKLKINLEKNINNDEINKTLVIILIIILMIVMAFLLMLQIKEKKRKKRKKKNVKKIMEEEIEVI